VSSIDRDHTVILVPVFNDWENAERLASEVDRVLEDERGSFRLLFVDDGSSDGCRLAFQSGQFTAIGSVEVLRLRRNCGHQRAIALGLCYCYEEVPFEAIIVMDGDGEDRPQDLPYLLQRYRELGGTEVVFARRTDRQESLLFRTFYLIYLVLHRVLIGFTHKVGNFSVFSRKVVSGLVASSDLWLHFSATVFKLRYPYRLVPLPRGRRFQGGSKMSFFHLCIHGLQAIIVHREVAATRIFLFWIFSSFAIALGIIAVACVRLFTGLAIPGWATNLTGILLILLGQATSAAMLFVFIVLGNKTQNGFLPLRDYDVFIEERRTVYGQRAAV
jgi:glycosyltransferase involved in cell wall biosynthesis